MKIGISIPYDYFSGAPESEAALILRKNVGDPASLLERLRNLQVEAIELRGVDYRAKSGLTGKTFNKLWECGFIISVHTSLPDNENFNGSVFFSFLENVTPHIKSFQKDLILVVHSYRGIDVSYETSLKKSATAINNIAEHIERKKLPIKIALELNRGNKERDPSVTYKGLLAIMASIKRKKSIGFCWDFGHAYSNFLRSGVSIEAPDEFVNKVIHTHIHGVDQNDQTHCPLTPENLPLKEFLGQLDAKKYEGISDLEINPQKMTKNNSAVDSIVNSVKCLTDSHSE